MNREIILVVDDVEDIRTFVKEALTPEGYEVIEAASGILDPFSSCRVVGRSVTKGYSSLMWSTRAVRASCRIQSQALL
jgi:CheY-like chemotaxis protein